MRISDWSSDVCSSDLDKQLAFVGQATTAAEARYRDTRALLKRLGLAPTRFVRQSRVAMGGPYEPVGNQDSDPAFRQLFASWTKVNTLEQAMLSVPALKPVRSFAMTSNFGVRQEIGREHGCTTVT